MNLHALAALASTPDTLTRWEVVVSLLAGMGILLGGIWRTGRKVVLAVAKHVTVTEANTEAIRNVTSSVNALATRVNALEERVHS